MPSFTSILIQCANPRQLTLVNMTVFWPFIPPSSNVDSGSIDALQQFQSDTEWEPLLIKNSPSGSSWSSEGGNLFYVDGNSLELRAKKLKRDSILLHFFLTRENSAMVARVLTQPIVEFYIGCKGKSAKQSMAIGKLFARLTRHPDCPGPSVEEVCPGGLDIYGYDGFREICPIEGKKKNIFGSCVLDIDGNLCSDDYVVGGRFCMSECLPPFDLLFKGVSSGKYYPLCCRP